VKLAAAMQRSVMKISRASRWNILIWEGKLIDCILDLNILNLDVAPVVDTTLEFAVVILKIEYVRSS
jgi:hypothetical protein